MKRLRLLALVAGLVVFSLSPLYAAGSSGGTLTVTAYGDGYAHVGQVFAADPKATTLQVPLLSPTVSDLVATDQNGSPLSYAFGSGGRNITVYTLGASSVDLSYDTNSLTSKNGTVWTLAFSSSYNSTVVLPPLSTLTSVSGVPNSTPYSIGETGSSPELALPAGSWTIAYGVPFSEATSSGSGSTTGSTSTTLGLPGGNQAYLAVGAIAAAGVIGALLFLWRRQKAVSDRGDLRPDDLQVLNFIKEKGGRVLEPEIRTRFALPKTSAWRQIKRLERMGYVKVTKVGSQNQIELMRAKDSES